MKGNIRRKERTGPLTSKPTINNDEHKTRKDKLDIEETSTLPQELEITNTQNVPKSDNTKILDTRNADNTQDQPVVSIPDEGKNGKLTSESDPTEPGAKPMDKTDEPLTLAAGRPKRNVRRPNRYGHNICERIRVGQAIT